MDESIKDYLKINKIMLRSKKVTAYRAFLATDTVF